MVRALAAVVGECGVPQQVFADLIRANRQDQVVTRYPAFSDLAGYCELSANPVGRIVLYVFGAATPERMILSDRVCTALQLAEHWQDVAEDYQAGRIYLPAEDMERFGCAESDLAAPSAGPHLRALMAFEVERAGRFWTKAPRWWGICTDLPGLPWPVTSRAAGPPWPPSRRPDMMCCALPTSRAAAGSPGRC